MLYILVPLVKVFTNDPIEWTRGRPFGCGWTVDGIRCRITRPRWQQDVSAGRWRPVDAPLGTGGRRQGGWAATRRMAAGRRSIAPSRDFRSWRGRVRESAAVEPSEPECRSAEGHEAGRAGCTVVRACRW